MTIQQYVTRQIVTAMGLNALVDAINQVQALGSMSYIGAWDASTNTPTITPGVGVKGFYYGVSVAGTTDIDGTNVWQVNDKIAFNGTKWERFKGADGVISLANLTGVISATQAKTALAIARADVSGLGSLAALSGITASLITDASANGRSFIQAANYAAMKALLALTAADVSGVLPLTGGTLTGQLNTDRIVYTRAVDIGGQDLNNLKAAGFYSGNSFTNSPDGTTGYFYVQVETYASDSRYVCQTAHGLTSESIWVRWSFASTWGSWKKVWYGAAGTGSGLDADTVDGQHASAFQAALGFTPINRAGDTMTGPLVLSGDPTLPMHPTTKQYVDAALFLMDGKQSCVCKTTANVNLAGGGLAAGTVHDTVTVVAGDRVCVGSQTAPAENGIYVVPAAGAASRALDMDSWLEIPGALVEIEDGSPGTAGSLFLCTAKKGGTLGTTAITWSQASSPTAGVSAFASRTGAVSPANDDYAVTMLQAIAANSFVGNNTGAAARPIVLTTAQAKTLLGLAKADVGLGNVDNTSDANKPVSTAQAAAIAARGAPDVIIEQQAASGTAGGGLTSGAYQTRPLNTLVRNAGSLASLASNQVTLPAGNYYAEFSAVVYQVALHNARLQNVTDSAQLGQGANGQTSGSGNQSNVSAGSCYFTLSGSKAIELQHRVSSSQASNGMGLANSWGTEVFAQLKIWKV